MFLTYLLSKCLFSLSQRNFSLFTWFCSHVTSDMSNVIAQTIYSGSSILMVTHQFLNFFFLIIYSLLPFLLILLLSVCHWKSQGPSLFLSKLLASYLKKKKKKFLTHIAPLSPPNQSSLHFYCLKRAWQIRDWIS